MKVCYFPLLIIAAFLALAVIYLALDCDLFSVKASSVNISAVVVSLCGNALIDPGEQCDGLNLDGQTCETLGFAGGTLNCSYCVFDTSACTGPAPPSGPRWPYSVPQATVIFEGKASPYAKIIFLKDAQVAATTTADNNADFQITLSYLSEGYYIFSVYSEDTQGIRSNLLVFPINVTANATTKVSGVFIAPTFVIDKEEVKKDEDILISGQSVPGANIKISVKSGVRDFFVNVVTDNEGKYSYKLNTAALGFGTYRVNVVAFFDNFSSNLSKTISFIVSEKTILKKPFPTCPIIGDFNDDCLVNLIDFSILIYWFDRSHPPSQIDLNEDREVNLTDFSIMAYYWTG